MEALIDADILLFECSAAAETELGPLQLLSLIKGIEATLGRVPSFTNGPRSIDVHTIL